MVSCAIFSALEVTDHQSQYFFDLTKAETESMVEPHGVANNFRGEPVTLVAGGWLVHAAQSAKPELN